MRSKEGKNKFCRNATKRLVEHARLVRRYHVLDVDERIFASVTFKSFQGFLNQISDVFSFLLAVIDSVARVSYNRFFLSFAKKFKNENQLKEKKHQISKIEKLCDFQRKTLVFNIYRAKSNCFL